MHALHDQNDARDLFVVRAADQRGAIPLDGPRSHRLGMGIVLLERIVDDHQVAAQSGQCALDRGGVTLAAQRGHDLAVGVTVEPHRREGGLVDRIVDQPAEIVGMGAREQVGIRDGDDALRRVVAEKPGRQRDGGEQAISGCAAAW